MSRPIFSTVAAVSLILAPAAQAAPTQVTFAGTVTGVTDRLTDLFAPGNALAGNFVYEPNTPNTFPDPESTAFDNAVLSTNLIIAGHAAALNGFSLLDQVNYIAPPTGSGFDDHFGLSANVANLLAAPLIGNYVITNLTLSFDDTTHTAITDPNILPQTLELATFTSATFAISLQNPENGDDNGTLSLATTGEVVPEPTAIAFIIPAAALLRRRR